VAASYGFGPMTLRETMILAAISALLSAAITVCIRIILENAIF
jgi:hypothetical protein